MKLTYYRIEEICYDYGAMINQTLGGYSYELTARIIEKVFNALDDRYVDMLLGNVVFIGVGDFSDRFKSGEYFNMLSFTTPELAVDVGLYSDNFSEIGDFDIRLDTVTHDPYTRGLSRGLLLYEYYEEWLDVSIVVDANATGLASDREYLLNTMYNLFNFTMLGNRDKLAIQNIVRVEFGVFESIELFGSGSEKCVVFSYYDTFGSRMDFIYGEESLEDFHNNRFASLICVKNYINE